MAYNITPPVKILTDGDMSLASLTSSVFETKLQDNIGIQVNFTGTPTGAFAVQVSLDYEVATGGRVLNPGTWNSLPLSPAVTASGSAGSAYIGINQLAAPYVRVVYTRTSGSGTLQIYGTGKGV
jgi:hypothetical protein